MRSLIQWCCVLVICLLPLSARASDPIGVYALIDRVAIEPSESAPERIALFGTFAVALEERGDAYAPPQTGWMYFTLPSDRQNLARQEWNDLREMAGKGQVVAFGSRYSLPHPTVRTGPGPQAQGVASWSAALERIKALNDDQQTVRDRASADLVAMGTAIAPGLKEEMAKPHPPETRARIEKLLQRLTPDVYVLGVGLNRFRPDDNNPAVRQLMSSKSNSPTTREKP